MKQILAGKDVMARARTGSGKTGAYCLPLIDGILKREQVELKTFPVLRWLIACLPLLGYWHVWTSTCANQGASTSGCSEHSGLLPLTAGKAQKSCLQPIGFIGDCSVLQ